MSIDGSVTSAEDVARLVDGCDVVVHLAGLSDPARCAAEPDLCLEVNRGGTERVCAASHAAGVGHVIVASTVHVYGLADGPLDEAAPCRPASVYAASKAAAEEAAREWSARGLRVTVVRLANVYATDSPTITFVGQVLADLRDGRAVRYRGGGHRRDFVHVDDVVDAIGRLIVAGPPSAPFELLNVGTGEGHTTADVAEMLCAMAREDGLTVEAPRSLQPSAAGDALVPAIAALRARIRWQPAISLREGLRRVWRETPVAR